MNLKAIRAMVVVGALSSVQRADACVFICFSKERVAAMYTAMAVLDSGVLATSGVSAAMSVATGKRGWSLASILLATLNTPIVVFTASQTVSLIAQRNWLRSPAEEIAGFAVAAVLHSSVLVWNIVAPILAIGRSSALVSMTPVAVGGVGRTGKRWLGAGVQVAF